MQSFTRTYHGYIDPSDTLILAVSGGVDSMVLLDLIWGIHPHDRIVIAHFDHSLRGIESDGDRELVANICNSIGITFEMKKVDIGCMAKSEKMNLEALARRERYRFLEEIRVQYNGKYILTAHHQNDQSETILLGLMKGGKVRGLSGMSIVSGNIFRPLLTVSKSDILAYAKSNTIEYREDSSNSDMRYERNAARHHLVPLMQELQPSIHDMISDLGEYMQEMEQFIDDHARLWLLDQDKLYGKDGNFVFHKGMFLTESHFFQREIIKYLYLEAHHGSTQGLSRGLIDELIRFISDPGSYGKKEVKKLHLERRGNKIYILSGGDHGHPSIRDIPTREISLNV